MELIMDAIRAVRTRRSEMNVPPSKKAHLTVATNEKAIFELGIPFLKKLAYASEVSIVDSGVAPEASGTVTVGHPRSSAVHAWPSWWTWRRKRPAWRRSSRRTAPSWRS